MKLTYPKVIKQVDLAEYAQEWGGQSIYVWANPPSSDLQKWADNRSIVFGLDKKKHTKQEIEQARDEFYEFMSVLLSQGKEKETHCDVANLKSIEEDTKETDPFFWVWLQKSVIETINDHRLLRKKA